MSHFCWKLSSFVLTVENIYVKSYFVHALCAGPASEAEETLELLGSHGGAGCGEGTEPRNTSAIRIDVSRLIKQKNAIVCVRIKN